MKGEPRASADVEVTGYDYDDLVAAARARAVDLLGRDRDYWLDLADVRPHVATDTGGVPVWTATARIAYPTDPAF